MDNLYTFPITISSTQDFSIPSAQSGLTRILQIRIGKNQGLLLTRRKEIKNSVTTQAKFSTNNIQEMIDEYISEYTKLKDKNTPPPPQANTLTPPHEILQNL